MIGPLGIHTNVAPVKEVVACPDTDSQVMTASARPEETPRDNRLCLEDHKRRGRVSQFTKNPDRKSTRVLSNATATWKAEALLGTMVAPNVSYSFPRNPHLGVDPLTDQAGRGTVARTVTINTLQSAL